MDNIDLTSIIKYKYSEISINNINISYIDYREDKESEKTINMFPTFSPTSFNTLSIQVFEKSMMNETVKTSDTTKLEDIYMEILDKYYEMSLKKEKQIEVSCDYSQTSLRTIMLKCHMCANIIARNGRIGPSNVIIVSDKILYGYLSTEIHSDVKVFLSPNDKYKDKIFVIRVNKDLTQPGLILLTSKNISNGRYIKLINIMNKMNHDIDNIVFDYLITDIGSNTSDFVECINLI
jgi:hypothetical protein